MEEQVVLDTSVVLKWFRQGEILAEHALSLRDGFLDGRLLVCAPTLLAYESANVLRYKGDLTTDQVEDAVQSLFDMGLEWVLPSAPVLRRAVIIARKFDATVYDAIFAALAEAYQATFVTADERLARRLASLRFVRFLGSMESEGGA
jgi:predicted nucleic acid-binding protein